MIEGGQYLRRSGRRVPPLHARLAFKTDPPSRIGVHPQQVDDVGPVVPVLVAEADRIASSLGKWLASSR